VTVDLDASPIDAEVHGLLQAIEHLNTFIDDLPGDPPLDDDGRVHPYCVFYPGRGKAFGDRLNQDTPTVATWTCRILFVGGDNKRAQWALARIRAALTGRLLSNGSRLKEVLDEVTTRTETNVNPSRTSGAILYRLHL
jgi:hypothetical protein